MSLRKAIAGGYIFGSTMVIVYILGLLAVHGEVKLVEKPSVAMLEIFVILFMMSIALACVATLK